MKGRSKVILGSLNAVRSGPREGKGQRLSPAVFIFCFLCVCMLLGLPASREDRSLSEDRPGERGFAVWTVGVVIWPR